VLPEASSCGRHRRAHSSRQSLFKEKLFASRRRKRENACSVEGENHARDYRGRRCSRSLGQTSIDYLVACSAVNILGTGEDLGGDKQE